MNKIILMIVFLLALSASGLMYFSGKETSGPSRFSEYFWIPLPLAFVALIFLVFSRSRRNY